MVRQARAMVADGDVGEPRLAQAEYVQGQLAFRPEGGKPDYWRYHSNRTGPSAILGDIGTHAYHLLHAVTGMEPRTLAADIGPVLPGRTFDDTAGVLLRYANGARGMLWVTQTAAGAEHGLRFRVHGDRGGLEWHQEDPTWLTHMPLGEPRRRLSRAGPGLKPAAERAARIPIGHPEGFHDAFANLYSDVAEAVAARLTGTPADPLALDFPTVEGRRPRHGVRRRGQGVRGGGRGVGPTAPCRRRRTPVPAAAAGTLHSVFGTAAGRAWKKSRANQDREHSPGGRRLSAPRSRELRGGRCGGTVQPKSLSWRSR